MAIVVTVLPPGGDGNTIYQITGYSAGTFQVSKSNLQQDLIEFIIGGLASSGGGSGTVTSVSIGNLSPLFTGSITNPTTTPAISFALSNAAQNAFLAGPTSGTGAPTYRGIVAADVPTLNQNTTGSAASFTGSLTGDVTGTQGATVVGKINGTSLAGLATGILFNTTATGVPSILTIGSGLTLTGSTLSSSSSGGTVTSFSAGNLSPLFTTSVATSTSTPALSFALSNAAQNAFLAGPTSGTGAPTYRGIVAADVPTLNQNTTGSAASFTGSLTGDVTGTQGATVVGKINGTSLAGLATGILFNTTATGVPSILTIGSGLTLTGSTLSSALIFGTGLTNTSNTVTVNTSQNISTLSNLTTNGAIFTSGGTGALSVMPMVEANLAAQTTAVASVLATTPGATGTYLVSAYAVVTALTVDTLRVSVTFSDENGTSRTVNLAPIGSTSTLLTTTGFSQFPALVIRAGTGSAITVSTTLPTSSGSITYDVGAVIQQIG